MKPFKEILLVYSPDTFDRVVLELVASLASAGEAHLTVVEVVEGLPSDVRRTIAIMRPLFLEQPEEPLIRQRTEQLVPSVELLRELGIWVNAKVLVGHPFREIVGEVLRNGYDLVILSRDRKNGWKERLFGGTTISGFFSASTVEKVLRRTHSSVLIVQPAHSVAAIPMSAQ